jgi:GcrA cell cycle regulator
MKGKIMQTIIWTDERVEQLKKLWEEGLSASQIAAEMAGIVSRNAVIGKVHRLGLKGRIKPTPLAQAAKNTKPLEKQAFVSTTTGTELTTQQEDITHYPDNIIPFDQRLALLELRESTCRWPVGDPQKNDFYFCGGRANLGTPYCAVHGKMAYQSVADRTKRMLKAVGR